MRAYGRLGGRLPRGSLASVNTVRAAVLPRDTQHIEIVVARAGQRTRHCFQPHCPFDTHYHVVAPFRRIGASAAVSSRIPLIDSHCKATS